MYYGIGNGYRGCLDDSNEKHYMDRHYKKDMRDKNRFQILALLAASCLMVACGHQDASHDDKSKNETETAKIEEETLEEDTETIETETLETETSETETSEEDEAAKRAAYYDQYEKYVDFISSKTKDQLETEIDEESDKLYQDFLAGKAKAVYDKKGDLGQYICLSEVLEDGQSYTLTEMEEKLVAEGQYSEGWLYDITEVSYIDAGLDGNYELHCAIGAAEFNLTLIVKNIGGKLKICFAGDSWSRCETNVYYNGEMDSFGSSGAVSHGGDHGYIDADGNFHFWYHFHEDGYEAGDDGELEYCNHFIGRHIYMWLESFTFGQEDGQNYYFFTLEDEEREEVPEDKKDPKDPYKLAKEALEAEGLTVVTEEDYKDMINMQRMKIGFTDDLYQYGDELKPEPYW